MSLDMARVYATIKARFDGGTIKKRTDDSQ